MASPTPNLSNYKAPTSVGGVKLPTTSTSTTSSSKKKYTDSLSTLNLSNPTGLQSQQGLITNQMVLPEHLRTTTSNGATSPNQTKITPPTSSNVSGSTSGGSYYGVNIDTSRDIAQQMAEIDRNRAGGSLNSPSAQAYISSQTGGSPVGTQSPAPFGSTPNTTGNRSGASTPKAEPSSYDLAMKSYLASLKNSQDLTAKIQQETLDANRNYMAEKDRDGGYQSGNDMSAARRSRMDNASLADLGIAETAATNAANLAFQRMQFEQGRQPEPYTLSAGQTRYDAQGNVLSSLDAGSDSPTSVQEYQFAVQNGYTGSYDQFKNTGSTPASVSEYQYAVSQGYQGSFDQFKNSGAAGTKASAAQLDALAGFDTTVGAAGEALNLLAGGVPTGPIASALLGTAKFFGTANEKQMVLEQLLGKLKADFMKALSGAAVSEQEAVRLAKFLPDISDQESVISSKLNTLIAETGRTKQNLLSTLQSQGGGQSYGGSQGGGSIWDF